MAGLIENFTDEQMRSGVVTSYTVECLTWRGTDLMRLFVLRYGGDMQQVERQALEFVRNRRDVVRMCIFEGEPAGEPLLVWDRRTAAAQHAWYARSDAGSR
jgi:hypothetical protein